MRPASFFILRDAAEESYRRTAFHIESGDYFGTLAAIVGGLKGILEDDLRAGTPPEQWVLDALASLRQDFIFLQDSHFIGSKDMR